jgi:hypothetical protein
MNNNNNDISKLPFFSLMVYEYVQPKEVELIEIKELSIPGFFQESNKEPKKYGVIRIVATSESGEKIEERFLKRLNSFDLQAIALHKLKTGVIDGVYYVEKILYKGKYIIKLVPK